MDRYDFILYLNCYIGHLTRSRYAEVVNVEIIGEDWWSLWPAAAPRDATLACLFVIVTPPRNSRISSRTSSATFLCDSHVVPSRYASTTSTRDACLSPRYGSSSRNACIGKTFRLDASRSACAKVTEVDSDAKEAVWGETKGRLCRYGQTGESP